MEAPSGTETFERVGWTDDFNRGPEGEQFKWDETMSSDALLLGRVTYDTFAPVWPHFEGELAEKFNSMPKYVVSSTLENPEWNVVEPAHAAVAATAERPAFTARPLPASVANPCEEAGIGVTIGCGGGAGTPPKE